ncbi:MAG: phage portal protein [Oscillospiraceae bacterium]
MASFKDFLGNIFKFRSRRISADAVVGDDEQELFTGAVNAVAVICVIEMISSLCAVAELKTYKGGKEFKGLEWHNLNIRPNVNQSATEFWKEFYSNLLWNGEVLVIPYGNQKIIADGFTVTEYALLDNIFSGVYKGDFTFGRTFKSSEVFYVKYSERPVRRVLEDILTVYSKLFGEAAKKYIKSGGSKGIMEIEADPSGDIDFEEKYSKSIDERMKKFNQAKDATLTLFKGMRYTPSSTSANAKASNEISDIKGLFDGALTRAAQMYKFPPQLILGEVSGIDDAINLALTACIDPLLNSVSEELSGKEFTAAEYLAGDFIMADTTNIKHIDIFSLAANIEKLISSAYMNVDEVRESSGKMPVNEPWSKIHFCTKNQEPITNLAVMGGGEDK